MRLTLPSGAGIRVESGVVEGSVVSVHYDPLLFKLIAHGSDRGQALERLTRALDACVGEGVKTTLPLLRTIAAHPEFRRGRVHTQTVEQGAFDGRGDQGTHHARRLPGEVEGWSQGRG